MKLATAQQIRAMDRETIDAFGVPGIVLMENAALGAVDAIVKRYGPLANKRVAIVCGKGNNGGDGLAIARHLAARYGCVVSAWLTEDPEAGGTDDFNANLEMARRFGIIVRPIEGWALFDSELAAADIIVDAILGTGIEGNPRPAAARGIAAINAVKRPVVAIDVPSGLNADTGTAGDPTVVAVMTVTFAFSKPGLHVYPGVDFAGEVVVADIGFPTPVRTKPEINILYTESADIAPWIPSRHPTRDANKGKFGNVLLIAGSPGFAGAAALTSHGAARSGAGLVSLAVPKAIYEIVMTRAPEVVMTKAFPDTPIGSVSNSALKAALVACEKADAVGIGPGMTSTDAGTREFVQRFVRECPIPLVLDADALNALAPLSDHGASIVRARTAATIMTPHPGELARLLGTDTASVQANRLASVRAATDKFGCIVLLKGSRTLIATPDGRLAINSTGNPGMASGGMGDVLTGVAATLAAQIADPWRAATAAAFVHGLAGDLAAARQGRAGLTATDLAESLPLALRECGV